jgi:hypothetical protein
LNMIYFRVHFPRQTTGLIRRDIRGEDE